MDRETAPEQTPPEQIPTTETIPTTAVPSAALSLDSTVEVNGASVKVRDLLQDRQDATALREYKAKASMLLRDGGEGEARYDAMRFVLKDEGYEPQQITDYIEAVQRAGLGLCRAHH